MGEGRKNFQITKLLIPIILTLFACMPTWILSEAKNLTIIAWVLLAFKSPMSRWLCSNVFDVALYRCYTLSVVSLTDLIEMAWCFFRCSDGIIRME